ncbi:MAG: UvrD-helicase domain-containing protein [Coriobacteriia bacterium]|nr:UvrD-helicase domain-containing protein [Coriobacteriia bacterium]
MTLLDRLYNSRFYDLNDEQRRAADDDTHRVVVVGAGAGTGKTQTLVARYLRLLLTEVERDAQGSAQGSGGQEQGPVGPEQGLELTGQGPAEPEPGRRHPLDRILAITYTNAAADEMRARVEAALRELNLLALARQMDRAWIATFHGFCTRVLRRHALEVGIDPGFRVLDDDDERVKLQRAGFEATLSAYFRDDQGQDQGQGQSQSQGQGRATLMRLLQYFSQSKLQGACFRLAAEAAKTGLAVSDLRPEDFSPEDLDRGCPPLPVMADLLKFADAWQQRYGALKQAGGTYDFDDLLLKCRDAFTRPHIRESYRAQFAAALLDEAQDTNALELALFEGIARRQFIVGDSKQSIYRFQGADVGVFGQLMERADHADPADHGDPGDRAGRGGSVDLGERADHADHSSSAASGGPRDAQAADPAADPEDSIYYRLQRNYRSRAEILDEINKLFATSVLLGEGLEPLIVGARERQCLPVSAGFPQAVAVVCVDLGATLKGPLKFGNNELKRQAAHREAEWIARQFRGLIGRPRQAKDGATAPIAPGDLVVLVAKRRFGKAIAAALKDQGLASQIIGGDDFLDQQAVCDARALLAALRNPRDDEAFLRLLLSRLGRVGDLGLAELACAARAANSTLWEAARQEAARQEAARQAARQQEARQESDPPALSDPVDAANLRQTVTMLAGAFARLGAVPLSEIIARAFAQRDADECMLASSADAAQSFADLQHLQRIADRVQESGGGLVDLIAYFDEKEELGGKFSSPVVSADAADVVRIMTIHASKGLQFPVVAVACAQDTDAVAASSASVFIQAGPGPRLGLKYTPAGADKACKTPTAQAVIEADKDAETFEKKRQLYVACTRAEQVLLLSYRRDAQEASISGALARAFYQRTGEVDERQQGEEERS